MNPDHQRREEEDIARIPWQPYEVVPLQIIGETALRVAYFYVTACEAGPYTRLDALAEHLLHAGHGNMLWTCSQPEVEIVHAQYGLGQYLRAVIRHLNEGLAARYPALRDD